MNTDASYVGRASHATDSEQSAKTAPQTPFSATNPPPSEQVVSRTIQVELLTAWQTWAADSLRYIERKRLLTSCEKKQAFQKLASYQFDVDKQIKELQDFEVLKKLVIDRGDYYPDDSDAVSAAMNYTVRLLIGANHYARIYEFPPFRNFQVGSMDEIWPYQTSFDVLRDNLAGVLYKGDRINATMLPADEWPAPHQLVNLQYRIKQRTTLRNSVGWFKQAKNGLLTLEYNHANLIEKRPDWSIPIRYIVRIFKVNTLERDVK